jgi:hypothetical protein
MTSHRTPDRLGGVSWSDRQIRQHAAGAFRHAVEKARATQLDAAKWCSKSERTIRDWLAGRGRVDLTAVLRSGRLRREALRYLTVCDQRVRRTLPHVVRAKRGHR